MTEPRIHAGIWKCHYCGKKAIHIGTDIGSSGTQCPNGCPGRFDLVAEYPLATSQEGINDAFFEVERRREKKND